MKTQRLVMPFGAQSTAAEVFEGIDLRRKRAIDLARPAIRRRCSPHCNGQLLTVDHGAPLRLLVPVKLSLKNVKGITRITYVAEGAMRGHPAKGSHRRSNF